MTHATKMHHALMWQIMMRYIIINKTAVHLAKQALKDMYAHAHPGDVFTGEPGYRFVRLGRKSELNDGRCLDSRPVLCAKTRLKLDFVPKYPVEILELLQDCSWAFVPWGGRSWSELEQMLILYDSTSENEILSRYHECNAIICGPRDFEFLRDNPLAKLFIASQQVQAIYKNVKGFGFNHGAVVARQELCGEIHGDYSSEEINIPGNIDALSERPKLSLYRFTFDCRLMHYGAMYCAYNCPDSIIKECTQYNLEKLQDVDNVHAKAAQYGGVIHEYDYCEGDYGKCVLSIGVPWLHDVRHDLVCVY